MSDLTRREFVKLSAAIGVAGLPLSAYGSRSRDTIRVGVVGCGGRGTGAALQAVRADPNAVLFAAGDAFDGRADTCVTNITNALNEDGEADAAMRIDVADDRQFVGFDAYQQVIDACDVVLLTTPPVFRPQHLAAAVRAKKHVFCEKPVAVDAPGVRSVIESAQIARDNNLALMSGFCWRYQDQVKAAMAKLSTIGELRAAHTTYNTSGWVRPQPRQPGWSDTEFMLRNWQYFHTLSGDHIVEQAVHAIDWQGWAFGDAPPASASAVGGRQVRPDTPETGTVWDHFAVTYEYDTGARAFHTCRHWPNTPFDNSGWFAGEDGTLHLRPWTGDHEVVGAKRWLCEAPGNDMYQREHDLLFASIRDGKPVNDGPRMAGSTLLAIMGRMAAYTGQNVTWEQALGSEESHTPDAWAFGDMPIPEPPMPGQRPAW